VPLTLVTGPANAAKAGEVLGGLRARVDDEPILVVPAFQDVEHAQRELAERGAVFGVSVLRFDRLFREIGRRTGHGEPIASDVQRELIVEEAVRRADLELLAGSAAQPGFVRAAAEFVAELERSMVEPPWFTKALRTPAGLADPELFAWHALDALRSDPARWGTTPVFVYGFDDFDALQLHALDTLASARHCGADVVVSLPHEAGRAAFKAIATVHQDLLGLGARETVLPPLDDHYAPESRAALHHVERSLFEDETEQVDAGGAIEFHTAAGQRAEIELAGARLRRLLQDGVQPGDIAVVLRRPDDYASLLEQVFGAYDIPFSIDRSVPLWHTGLVGERHHHVRAAVLGAGERV
jgi:ATP-dependent helicase/DNAse subunit B